MPALPSLTSDQATEVRRCFGTPCYVYNRARIESAARTALAFPAPFGLTVRYAMKANSNRGVLSVLRDLGLHIDASSDIEVERALRAGFPPATIQLTSQVPSARLQEHCARGVMFNACSVHQLEQFGRVAPGHEISVRLNPGVGSGSTKRTNTGGPASSFGIWHEYLNRVQQTADRYRLRLTRLHTHIGSGTNPVVWQRATRLALAMARRLPEVHTINLGGGFKVARMPHEASVDLAEVGKHVHRELTAMRAREGRSFRLEIEPGTYLMANAGCIVAQCVDVVDTGRSGYVFAKLDAGLPELIRPSFYGAQHPIDVVTQHRKRENVVFVGPCCESGDILTPAAGNRERLAPRRVRRPKIGDLVIIGGAGAYCAAMATINYNSYPQAPEVMLENGRFRLLRRRQAIDQIWTNEL